MDRFGHNTKLCVFILGLSCNNYYAGNFPCRSNGIKRGAAGNKNGDTVAMILHCKLPVRVPDETVCCHCHAKDHIACYSVEIWPRFTQHFMTKPSLKKINYFLLLRLVLIV